MTPQEYFKSHGVDETFLTLVGVTWGNDRINYPITKDGKVVFTKSRLLSGDIKFHIPTGITAKDYLYTPQKIDEDNFVVYCEGEIDAIKLSSIGIPSISGLSGANTAPGDLSIFTDKDVFVCFDSDEAGKRGIKTACEAIKAVARSIRVISLPTETKDVCDYFVSGKTRDDFDDLMIGALSYEDYELSCAPQDFYIQSLEELKLKELPEERWLIDGIVPSEGFVLIAGEQATGKSFITLSIADSITTGKKWLDIFEVKNRVPVLFIDKENGERRTQDRMKGLGMSGKDIYRIQAPHLLTFTDPKDPTGVSKFAQHIADFARIKKIGLIVVDSLVDVMEGDENRSADVQLFLDKFRFLFPNSAILLLHHEGKPSMTQRSSAQRTRGSSNIQAQMVSSFSISRLQGVKNEFRFEQTKFRDSMGINPFKVNMVSQVDSNNPTQTIVTKLMHGGEIKEELAKGLEAASVIQDLLPRELDKESVVITRQDLIGECELVGIAQRTLDTTLSQLKKSGLIASEPLPKGHPKNDKFNKTYRWYIPMNTQTFYQNSPKND